MQSTAQIIPFSFEKREIRTLLVDDQPWFCGVDVCSALGYVNSRQAIQKNCRPKGVSNRDTPTAGGQQSLTFIDEGNLYRLIIKSRKQEAQVFEEWVCDEVLPSIRRQGRYDDTQNKMDHLIADTIGKQGHGILSELIKGKVSHLRGKARTSVQSKLWAQVHKAFQVDVAADIPVVQLDSARNFIGAYVLEGDFLPATEQQPQQAPTPQAVFKAKRIPSDFDRRHGLLSPEQMFDCGWRVDLLWAVKWLKEHEGQTVKLEQGLTDQLTLELNSILHWYESYRNKLMDIRRLAV
jgi:prophage antirepressor-like protein